MYNQILSFRPEEACAHVYELNQRHCPDDWKIADLHFESDQGFVRQTTTYHNDENDSDIICATRYFNYQTVGDNSHVLIDLEITSACNASCSFCPRMALNRKNKFISMDIVNSLAEYIRYEGGKRQVILCGIGEPTLHPELETIVQTLSGAGTKVCMTTNGSHMNVDKFRQLVDAGMVEFNFSLNASTPETHQYVMNMKDYNTIKHHLLNILALRKVSYPEIDINVSFVYCGQNRHEVVDFVNEWKSCDVSNIWIHPVNNRADILSKGLVDADILPIQKMFADDKRVLVDIFKHKSAEGNICKIAQSLDFISVDGEKLLCAMDYAGDTSFGNVQYATLGQTYLAKISSYINKDTEEICTGCDFYHKE
jgi:MoaA/NifB/PqqE/SkfB family radical SAM enzyme